MSPLRKGVVLGAANMGVLAVAAGVRDDSLHVTVVLFVLGLVPALLSGAVVGHVASVLKASHAMRAVVFVAIAVGIVVAIGAVLGLINTSEEGAFVCLACISSAIGGVVLERWTRSGEPIAEARVVER